MSDPTPPLFRGEQITLPESVRLWQPGDPTGTDTPVLDPVAFHGPIGKYIQAVTPGTEAHPAAIAATIITYVGCYIGRDTFHYRDGMHSHSPNLYTAIVGHTSTGGKTSSQSAAGRFFDFVFGDSNFDKEHTERGLASGEALVAIVADTAHKVDKSGNTVVAFQGVEDKRRVVNDAELAGLIKRARRGDSTLGENLIAMYDGETVAVRTKKTTLRATKPHVAILSTITPAAFRDEMTATMIANGFANRFIYVFSEVTTTSRVKGVVDEAAVFAAAQPARAGLEASIKSNRPVHLDSAAESLLDTHWSWLRFGRGIGAVEMMTGRSLVHALRIATIYAAMDNSTVVTADHLRAGIAWASYSADTVEWMMEGTGSGIAVKLLRTLRDAGSDGMTGDEQLQLFGRHVKASDLASARDELEGQHLIHTAELPTGGRPKILSVATTVDPTAGSKP